MGTINHLVQNRPDLQLAMIEGTQVTAWCGIRFVPEVQVGTSGSAHAPGAPECDRCRDVVDTWREWIRLKDEKNRLVREMNALRKLQRTRLKEWQEERERVPELVP